MAKWSNLPQEILQQIIDHLVQTSPRKTKNLKACQLVCKNWSRAAQKALYRHVKLGKNATLLFSTLTSPQIGSLVNEVVLLDEFHMQYVGAMIDVFKVCTNIKDIYTCHTVHNWEILPMLNSKACKIKGLQKYVTKDDWAINLNPEDYVPLALKYKDTMTDVYLPFGRPGKTQELGKKIHLFGSLRGLYIAHSLFTSLEEFDNMINACSATVQELGGLLWFAQKCQSDNLFRTGIKPNTSIKKVSFNSIAVPAPIFRYLRTKFSAMEELHLNYQAGIPSQASWPELLEASFDVKRFVFDISYYPINGISFWGHLQKAFDFMQKTIPPSCFRSLKLVECDSDCKENLMHTDVSLEKANGSYCLGLHMERNHEYPAGDLWKEFASYSADSIFYSFANLHEFYERLTYLSKLDYDTDESIDMDVDYEHYYSQELVPSFAIYDMLRPRENDKYWSKLEKLFKLLDPAKDQELCLENMLLFEQKRKSNTVVQKISTVVLKNTVLQHSVLPVLSQRLPKIDRLVLDTCCILMDDENKLQVFLPTTRIHSLQIVIQTLADGLGSEDFQENYRSCQLENNQLLDALLLSDKPYILKIETEAKTYISKRRQNVIIEDNCQDTAVEEAGSALIWIKCKELSQLMISFGPAWDEAFEKLE